MLNHTGKHRLGAAGATRPTHTSNRLASPPGFPGDRQDLVHNPYMLARARCPDQKRSRYREAPSGSGVDASDAHLRGSLTYGKTKMTYSQLYRETPSGGSWVDASDAHLRGTRKLKNG